MGYFKETNKMSDRVFGNVVLDFLYKGKGSFSKQNLQKFIDKQNYPEEFVIYKINLVYPEIIVDYGFKKDGKMVKDSITYKAK